MRILWFTNSPSLAAQKIAKTYNVGSSWIESLEQGLVSNKDIELGIAFSWNAKKTERFQVPEHPTHYFKMPRYPFGKWTKLFYRHTCSLEPLTALNDYLKVVEEFQPEVVHFFGTESIFPLIIPHLKIPSIIWFQGNLTVYHEKWESAFSIWKIFKYEKLWNILNGESIAHDYYQDKKLVKREKEIFSYAQNFSCRTDWDKRLVSVMAPQAKVFHLEEAMREPFHQKEWHPHRNRDKFVLVTTVRSNPYKGLETVMEASKLLAPLIPKKLEWRIVGISEDDPYVKACKAKTTYSKSDTFLNFLGFRSGPELAKELLHADTYVHPTHIDNSPNSVCEAMLMGLPVVATNVGGVPCLLKDHEEGLLVQSGDGYALAGAILEIYHNPRKASRMGSNARNRGKARNDLNTIIEALLKIYEELTSSKEQDSENEALLKTLN